MTAKLPRFMTGLGLALLTAASMAHHSTRGIYQDEDVELTGTVLDWRFINPHPYLTIAVKGDDGETHEWDVSYGGAAVVHLQRQGYSESTFKKGDVIKVKGKPARAAGVYGLLIEGTHPTWEDGSRVVEGGSMF
jgi:hypothetical protein